ncbi:MAG TPA: VOC family protein [Solirubrobacteraceae bacterium]|nr:VOC family protein [Solirubrobacteraceae bacterium]
MALSHIGLAVDDPPAAAAYYARTLGLVVSETLADGTIRLGWGRGFHALELTAGHGLAHFGLELSDEAGLAGLESRLQAHGVPAAREELAGDHLPVLAFRDPDGHRVEAHGPVDRSGEHAADPGRRPVRIHHVTFASPAIAEQVAFYEQVLGFRVSDRMGEVFAWLRCNQEHHTVAVVEADKAGLDHYAYEIDSWASLKTWCDELAARDVALQWGPGRHGPGNNVFVMFDDLDGNRVELSCEMERYWDDCAQYAPRHWAPGAKTVNLWGPVPAWR